MPAFLTETPPAGFLFDADTELFGALEIVTVDSVPQGVRARQQIPSAQSVRKSRQPLSRPSKQEL